MNLGDYTWHCIYSAPQKELETGYKLVGIGHQVIIPAEKKWRDKGGHTRITRQPVLPRYVFTGFAESPNWEFIRSRIPTAMGYLQFGSGPTIVSLPDMEWLYALKEAYEGRQRPTVVEGVIRVGDRVKVIHGPFSGESVTVDKVVADKIHVIKQFLGAPRLFKIPVDHLSPV